jgi:hypothetical protein
MQERRGIRRFALSLPAVGRIRDGGYRYFETHTRDVSARGVYLYLQEPATEASTLEFVLTLPPVVTLTGSIPVRCTARVVRVDRDSDGNQVGVATLITQYEFLGGRGAP